MRAWAILNKMKITDFKLKKNRQRPEMCYSWEKKEGDTKWSIFTMNGGQTFLASIEQKRMDGKFYEEFSETFKTKEECLTAFKTASVG